MSIAPLIDFAPAPPGAAAFNSDTLDQDLLFEGQCVPECDGRGWWVMYTKSRQEKALAQNLLTRRVPHFLPLHRKYSLSRGRRLCSLVPLFSGYVFVFADGDERIAALESNRVARSIAVPQSGHNRLCRDLLQIRQLIESGVPLTPESRIQSGQHVRVKSGRLAGLEGIVTKRLGRSRLLVAVNYLQQGASVEIEDFALEVT